MVWYIILSRLQTLILVNFVGKNYCTVIIHNFNELLIPNIKVIEATNYTLIDTNVLVFIFYLILYK